MSRFNITPGQFYDLTLVEFYHAQQCYVKEQERKERFNLEMMRLQTMYLVNPHIKQAVTDPRKFMPFTWDKFEVYVPTNDEWNELRVIHQKLWHQKQSTN